MRIIDAYEVPVYRLQLVQEGIAQFSNITTPEALAEHLHRLATSDREEMVAVFLNTKHQPIGQQLVSVGTLNATLVSPGSVFKGALMANAAAIALAHNHPSGDVTPSIQDDRVTANIAQAGKVMDIRLLDHLILSPNGNFYAYSQNKPALLEGD